MCNRDCPEFKKTHGTCCLCHWILDGFKCKHYKCDPGSTECAQRIAEDNLVAQWEAEQELPDYIEEDV